MKRGGTFKDWDEAGAWTTKTLNHCVIDQRRERMKLSVTHEMSFDNQVASGFEGLLQEFIPAHEGLHSPLTYNDTRFSCVELTQDVVTACNSLASRCGGLNKKCFEYIATIASGGEAEWPRKDRGILCKCRQKVKAFIDSENNL